MTTYHVRRQFTGKLILQERSDDGWIDCKTAPSAYMTLIDVDSLAALEARVEQAEKRAAAQRKARKQ